MLRGRPRLVSPGYMLWCAAGATDPIFLPRKVSRQNGAPEGAMCAEGAATIKKTRLPGSEAEADSHFCPQTHLLPKSEKCPSFYIASRATMLGNM